MHDAAIKTKSIVYDEHKICEKYAQIALLFSIWLSGMDGYS